ncbi:MAG TPA: HEAT repeat domain-containing protein [Caldilineaceae bacterium]|nr:HEAT repeat domain-containing protein [Caldilineaceae bacterium]
MEQNLTLLGKLTIPHHAREAYRQLLLLGFAGVPIARAGLRHESAAVRHYCCAFLDHFLVPEALPDLIGMLHDPDPAVRLTTLHTLACDRCKEGACRPEEAAVLSAAVRLLQEDTDAHVRAMAVEAVGQYVHTNPLAEQALVAAHTDDISPAVRKKAGWYAPGGPIFQRTAPRAPRKQGPRSHGKAQMGQPVSRVA